MSLHLVVRGKPSGGARIREDSALRAVQAYLERFRRPITRALFCRDRFVFLIETGLARHTHFASYVLGDPDVIF